MEITWLGHASVCINSRDILLVTDPYDSSEGLFMPPSKAHIVLSSNSDPKHANTSAITGSPRIINGPGEYEISHFYVTGTGTAGTQAQILIAPISGDGSLNKTDLQEIVSAIQPRILIPVQHGANGPEGLQQPQEILTDMGITELPDPTPRLNVTEANLPPELQIQMLRRVN